MKKKQYSAEYIRWRGKMVTAFNSGEALIGRLLDKIERQKKEINRLQQEVANVHSQDRM